MLETAEDVLSEKPGETAKEILQIEVKHTKAHEWLTEALQQYNQKERRHTTKKM